MKPFAFPKNHRILKRHEFLEFYASGKAVHSSGFVLVYKDEKTGISRIGITVSRKVGKAAVRNRIKRVIREYYRHNRSNLTGCRDFHVIAKKQASTLTNAQLIVMLGRLFEKLAASVSMVNQSCNDISTDR
jgi:ribonuclease P protein component